MNVIRKDIQAFALIEIMIALMILSTSVMAITGGISNCILAIDAGKGQTKAMLIAKYKLNEFMIKRMRGLDLRDEPVTEYPGFTHTRTTERFEHPFLGAMPAKKTDIVISWKERGKKKKYSLSYIFPTN
ncbi:MAG: hypothetical protein GY754_44160 [bacterium]|nr:hypothetical protein [bacterium]